MASVTFTHAHDHAVVAFTGELDWDAARELVDDHRFGASTNSSTPWSSSSSRPRAGRLAAFEFYLGAAASEWRRRGLRLRTRILSERGECCSDPRRPGRRARRRAWRDPLVPRRPRLARSAASTPGRARRSPRCCATSTTGCSRCSPPVRVASEPRTWCPTRPSSPTAPCSSNCGRSSGVRASAASPPARCAGLPGGSDGTSSGRCAGVTVTPSPGSIVGSSKLSARSRRVSR